MSKTDLTRRKAEKRLPVANPTETETKTEFDSFIDIINKYKITINGEKSAYNDKPYTNDIKLLYVFKYLISLKINDTKNTKPRRTLFKSVFTFFSKTDKDAEEQYLNDLQKYYDIKIENLQKLLQVVENIISTIINDNVKEIINKKNIEKYLDAYNKNKKIIIYYDDFEKYISDIIENIIKNYSPQIINKIEVEKQYGVFNNLLKIINTPEPKSQFQQPVAQGEQTKEQTKEQQLPHEEQPSLESRESIEISLSPSIRQFTQQPEKKDLRPRLLEQTDISKIFIRNIILMSPNRGTNVISLLLNGISESIVEQFNDKLNIILTDNIKNDSFTTLKTNYDSSLQSLSANIIELLKNLNTNQ